MEPAPAPQPNSMVLDSQVPDGPIADLWENHKFSMNLVNPSNKRKFEVIVVGTGLAGASAAATLGELGYRVKAFTFHDSPRRAHSIAAQGGINAAKNCPSPFPLAFFVPPFHPLIPILVPKSPQPITTTPFPVSNLP